jgi:hypothetical protein
MRPIDPQALALHDAVLQAVESDLAHRRVRLRLDVFLDDGEEQTRTHCVIAFEGVTRHIESLDWDELAHHAPGGNVSHWVPAHGAGTTVFHLAHGFLSVTAERIDALVDG